MKVHQFEVGMKYAILAALAAILVVCLHRVDSKVAEVAEENRLDQIFGDIAESAAKAVYLEEDPELVGHRERFARQCLQEAIERRTWDAEIRDGLRCFYCKGPHPWSWCAHNHLAIASGPWRE